MDERTVDEGEDDPREEIVRLEAEIEQLAETIESCRKLILIAKGAMGVAAILIVTALFGLLRLDPGVLIGAFGVMLGAVVVYGSNASTRDQARSATKAAEARRAALIGKIELRVVSGGNGRAWLN